MVVISNYNPKLITYRNKSNFVPVDDKNSACDTGANKFSITRKVIGLRKLRLLDRVTDRLSNRRNMVSQSKQGQFLSYKHIPHSMGLYIYLIYLKTLKLLQYVSFNVNIHALKERGGRKKKSQEKKQERTVSGAILLILFLIVSQRNMRDGDNI